MQCTGYRTWPFCDISDEMHIYYNGVLGNLNPIAAPGTAPYCRDQPVTVSVGGAAGATANTTYNWVMLSGSTSVGGITGTGTTATLDLRRIAPTTGAVTVQVQASDNSCAGPASVTNIQTITLPLAAAAPQPQDMVLNNGLCAGPNTKTVSVDGSSGGGEYEWRISGNGAAFFPSGATLVQPSSNNSTQSITALVAAPVTVTVRKRINACGGFGPPLSTTYQIDNLTPAPVVPVVQRNECPPYDIKLIFEPVPSGLNYYPGQVSNVSNPGLTIGFTQATAGSPVFNITGAGSGRISFDLTYFVQSPCPGPGNTGFGQFSTNVFIQKRIGGVVCRGVAGAPSEPVAEPQLKLYPNPTSGMVTLAADVPTHYQWVKVFDAQGTLRYRQESDAPAGIQSFDIQSLAPGIYLVQLFDGNHLTSQRLAKDWI